jgi:cytochrome c553/NADPH-dependent 2,4-dienoyl-CoA reductase/sulfur reductase-like enzyme
MARMTRREFLKTSSTGVGALAVGGLAGCASTRGEIDPKATRRIVVVGGGWGGATAAKYARLADPSIEVVLLEPNKRFVSCPLSNLVLSGVRGLGSLSFGYNGLREHGVKVRHEAAAAIEPDRRRVRVGDGYLVYDRAIVSPGVDFLLDQVEGLAAAQDRVLHAWKAGPQTLELARQLRAMPDGGVFVLTVPPVAYRCPPGPYERICQVAWYLKTNKPKSKLIVLDANQNIVSKPALFRAAWKDYPNIDYRPSSKVVKVDAGAREVTTEFGDKVTYDVVNLIPPQRAGAIAVQADLVGADKRWCEVDHVTYESLKHRGVHVVGDATTGLPVPKSGTIANAMGKICANAVVHLMSGRPALAVPPVNTCYSWVNDREAMAVVNAYKIENGKVVQVEQKLTPGHSTLYAQHADGWAKSIWADMLGALAGVALLLGLAGPAAAGPLDVPGYAKAVTCGACHGTLGNSRSEAVPILAGLAPGYFTKAIEDYATGKRLSPEMEPFAKQVKILGVDELAAFFAAQAREPTPVKPDRRAVERGRAASPQCATCHGPEGQGDAAKLIPRIAGQPAGYIRNQLMLFKADKRSPGDEALTKMKSVLKPIPDETLADVAAYYSSLR